MKKKSILFYAIFPLLALFTMVSATGCIEDGFSNSPADQPVFSTDTLHMGVIFTDQPSPTHRFVVYNRHGKGMNIASIRLSGENASLFRLNVDGMTGNSFDNVEIRANDSIFVFVEATLPQNGQIVPVDVDANLDFVTNGVLSSVVINAQGRDVEQLRGVVFDKDTRLGDSGKPYQVFDSLVVAPGATLTLAPGTTLFMHDKSSIIVRGRLIADGTLDKNINICGDRVGNVITNVTFDLMAKQWDGIWFTPTSSGSRISYTHLRNTVYGLTIAGDPDAPASELQNPMLTLVNSRLRNSGDNIIYAEDATIVAAGCEFAEAASGIILLNGGKYLFEQCTFANYYLFSAIAGPAIGLLNINEESADPERPGRPFTEADFNNCIIYGIGADISHGDLTGTKVFLRNCLLKSEGTNDDNFIDCVWGEDPLYFTVREDYLFDYRLKPDSPAIGAGNGLLNTTAANVDALGRSRPNFGTTDIGAYVFSPDDAAEYQN